MGYRINMPKLEQGMQQGVLIAWLVDVGEEVVEGEPIADIESEKTATEIEARQDGVLRRTFVDPGETVSPGIVLGVVAGPDESIDDLFEGLDIDAAANDDADAETSQEAATAFGTASGIPGQADGEAVTAGAAVEEQAEPEEVVRASPAAKRLAEKWGVDLAAVEGTGPEGAVVSEDVERVTEAGEATVDARRQAEELSVDITTVAGTGPGNAVTVADVEAAANGVRERRELSGMRRTIAERLGWSHREAPHVTVHREVDVEELLAAIDVADRYADVPVSIMDLLLIAVSATLAEYPEFNGHFEDDVHTVYDAQHVGVAVDIDRGLVTPVVEHLELRSLEDLAARRQELIQKVLQGDFTSADITGATFTVSNLGGFGVDSFTPIINPPEVAILGVDRIAERPVPAEDGDGVAFRRHMGFDLSFDHRVVDGADAAQFLATLADHVKDPWPLLLDRA
jgi:pyruvate dehydrogenase E2 component (dihydrolipoamide acetyltransferase)